MISKEIFEQLKNSLEKDKTRLEKELDSFAEKNKDVEGDYKAKWPVMGDELDEANLDVEASEIEEFGSRLSIEHALEEELKNINEALVKIEKGGYGICENCKKEMDINRLHANPSAKICIECK